MLANPTRQQQYGNLIGNSALSTELNAQAAQAKDNAEDNAAQALIKQAKANNVSQSWTSSNSNFSILRKNLNPEINQTQVTIHVKDEEPRTYDVQMTLLPPASSSSGGKRRASKSQKRRASKKRRVAKSKKRRS